jgi:hypothetical protein
MESVWATATSTSTVAFDKLLSAHADSRRYKPDHNGQFSSTQLMYVFFALGMTSHVPLSVATQSNFLSRIINTTRCGDASLQTQYTSCATNSHACGALQPSTRCHTLPPLWPSVPPEYSHPFQKRWSNPSYGSVIESRTHTPRTRRLSSCRKYIRLKTYVSNNHLLKICLMDIYIPILTDRQTDR